ncbi:MAG: 3-isopropylmalate dehydratase small subunit [Bacteroidota bacterium]
MQKFETLSSTAVPLPIENVDTDQIIPARFLKATDKVGFGENLFRDWRYNKDGSVNSGFVLNNATFSGSILVAGENFGCGSSREHAAWALEDYGFKVVISSYFADIFRGNALNNGILPIIIAQEQLNVLLERIQEKPETNFLIDLPNQELVVEDLKIRHKFAIDTYNKMFLINVYDDIDFLIIKRDVITAFEEQNA